MRKITPTIVVFLTLSPNVFYAQCSDAGVCVVGSQHAFGRSGKTDDLTVHSFQIEGDIQFFHDSRLIVRLPWSRTSGPIGHASGIGDLTLLWNQTVREAAGDRLSVQAGGKFATGNANSTNLPQAYLPG